MFTIAVNTGLLNNGAITNGSGAYLADFGGLTLFNQLTNSGTLYISSGASLEAVVHSLSNDGTIINSGRVVLSFVGAIFNNGTFVNTSGASLFNDNTLNSSSTLINSGNYCAPWVQDSAICRGRLKYDNGRHADKSRGPRKTPQPRDS
jgi:hypothetical protein